MKSIYKIAIASLVAGFAVAAFAQEVDATSPQAEEVVVEEVAEETAADTSVADRVDCEEIKVKIAELSEIEEPDETTVAELTELKAQQRKSCMRRAGARAARSATRGRGAPIKNPTVAPTNVVADTVAVSETPADTEPKTCDVPDENGCCPGEKFVDMGELGFNCCPESGGDCFPPIKTEPTPEDVAKNIEAGLCADGSKPNKFGCCGEEVFKDLGNTVFACCPKGWERAEDCFPPIKK